MGKKIWIATGVVAAVGLTVAVAHAQRGEHGGHGYRGGSHGGYQDEQSSGWNGRGRDRGGWGREVTKEDFDAMTRTRFAKWDSNNDGIVDRTEVEARLQERGERRSKGWGHHRRGGGHMKDGGQMGGGHMGRQMRRFDTDRDGKVTKAEVETAVTERFQRIDLDGDGRITDADLPPMMRGMNVLSGEGPGYMGHHMGRRHGRRGGGMLRHIIGADTDKDGEITVQEAQDHAAARFARFDRNGDGVIDTADRDALRAEMLDYRVRRFFHRFGAGDGKLTLEQYQKHRNERFARRDVDSDDMIERGEHRDGWGRGYSRGSGYEDRDNRGADDRSEGEGERRDPQ